jgi:hypothetical protein
MMGRKKALPPRGQRCQNRHHGFLTPSLELSKVYYEKGHTLRGAPAKFCYEWWCEECCIDEEIEPREEGWPTGDDGRFMTAVQCQTIPELD